tara:strand:+ start:1414 stop:2337 length:924 start_codon:yes stop_codon:yes gene_type:complete
MKFFKIAFFFIFLILVSTIKSFSFENKILLKIDNEIITTIDVKNEANYLSLLVKDFEQLEGKKIYEISLNSLIREKVKEIELRKHFKSLEVKEDFLNPRIKIFMKKLNFNNHQEFENYINSKNINFKSIKKKISHELLWNKLIYDKFNSNVRINKEEIKKNIKINSKQTEYLLSEILFNIDNIKKLDDKFKDIKKIILNEGFVKAALISSDSDSAKNNGLIGWVKENSISKNINNKLKKINKGEFTDPIKVPGGFIILYINDIRTIENKNIDKQLNLIIKEKTNNQLNQFSNIYFNKIKKNININEL